MPFYKGRRFALTGPWVNKRELVAFSGDEKRLRRRKAELEEGNASRQLSVGSHMAHLDQAYEPASQLRESAPKVVIACASRLRIPHLARW